MALTLCKECGHEISTKADKCPSCGAPVKRKGIGCGGYLGFIILFLVGSAILVPQFAKYRDREKTITRSEQDKKLAEVVEKARKRRAKLEKEKPKTKRDKKISQESKKFVFKEITPEDRIKRDTERVKKWIGKRIWPYEKIWVKGLSHQDIIGGPRVVGVKLVKFEEIKNSIPPSAKKLLRDSVKHNDPIFRFTFKAQDGTIGYYYGADVDFLADWSMDSNFMRTFYSWWNKRVWSAIANEMVFMGMEKDAVLLSWGQPKEVSKLGSMNEEIWTYGDPPMDGAFLSVKKGAFGEVVDFQTFGSWSAKVK